RSWQKNGCWLGRRPPQSAATRLRENTPCRTGGERRRDLLRPGVGLRPGVPSTLARPGARDPTLAQASVDASSQRTISAYSTTIVSASTVSAHSGYWELPTKPS